MFFQTNEIYVDLKFVCVEINFKPLSSRYVLCMFYNPSNRPRRNGTMRLFKENTIPVRYTSTLVLPDVLCPSCHHTPQLGKSSLNTRTHTMGKHLPEGGALTTVNTQLFKTSVLHKVIWWHRTPPECKNVPNLHFQQWQWSTLICLQDIKSTV